MSAMLSCIASKELQLKRWEAVRLVDAYIGKWRCFFLLFFLSELCVRRATVSTSIVCHRCILEKMF